MLYKEYGKTGLKFRVWVSAVCDLRGPIRQRRWQRQSFVLMIWELISLTQHLNIAMTRVK